MPSIFLEGALGNPKEEEAGGPLRKKMEIVEKLYALRPMFCTCMTVRGLSDGYQRGKPNRVKQAERIRYVSEHLVLITLAPKTRNVISICSDFIYKNIHFILQ